MVDAAIEYCNVRGDWSISQETTNPHHQLPISKGPQIKAELKMCHSPDFIQTLEKDTVDRLVKQMVSLERT